jgi:hypothetical protein
MVGAIYTAVDYNNQAGHPIATNIAVAWGNCSRTGRARRRAEAATHRRRLGAVLVATDGAIVAGPMQSAPLKLPGYAQIPW